MNETNNEQGFVVKVDGGYFSALPCLDTEYPGISIEYVDDAEDFNNPSASRPTILFEKPKNDSLRLLVWDNDNDEDYSKEIGFD